MNDFRILSLIGIAVLAGCAVNPTTARSQFILFPAAQIAHADLGYALASAAQGLAPSTARDRVRVAAQARAQSMN